MRDAKKPGGLAVNPLLRRTESDLPTVSAEDQVPAKATSDPSRAREETSKFTFYFTPDQLDRLDRVWLGFRRRARGSKRRVTKSQLVRLAVDRLLDDAERRPDEVFAALWNLTDRESVDT